MRSTEFCDVATARNMRKAAQAAPYLRDPIADRRWQRDHCARNQTADDVSTRLERQGAAGSSDKAPSMGTIPAKIRFASERTSSSRLPAIVARVSGIKLDHESLRSHPAADSSSRKIVCDTPRGLWRPSNGIDDIRSSAVVIVAAGMDIRIFSVRLAGEH